MARGEKAAAFRESARHEENRIGMLQRERGRDETIQFAQQTLRSYRRAVVTRAAPAGDPVLRARLTGSYCYLKRWLEQLDQRP